MPQKTLQYELRFSQQYKSTEGTVTFDSLERSFVSLYDEVPSPLDVFFNELKQPAPAFNPVGNPNVNSTASYVQIEASLRAEQDAENKKLASTPEGLAELRRRALFGDKTTGRTISTGTSIVPKQ